MSSLALDVVICTHNHAALLDRTLDALAAQRGTEGVMWSVLVVDNNCTDATPAVIARHEAEGRIPGLRRLLEPQQGLTPARHAGVRHTTAEWIAFVDDDCLLAAEWIAQAAAFLREHPESGAMGGRVVLDWEVPPPGYLHGYGWAFAEQERGDTVRRVESLVGAGMVVRREALRTSGWLSGPLLDDRVGERLVSGGDVELALRIRGSGYALWYHPVCVLHHVIPAHRTARGYLLRMMRSLGVSQVLATALLWPGEYDAWQRESLRTLRRDTARVLKQAVRALRQRHAYTPALLDLGFVGGNWAGLWQVLRMAPRRRAALLGRALCRNASPSVERADV